MSPTFGVGSLTVLVNARSACWGVTVAEAVLLAVLGSNWSASLIVAVLVCAVRRDDGREQRQRRRRAGGDRADVPQTGRRRVCALARGRRHEGQAGRQQVGDLDTGRRVGAGVGDRDRERHRVTDVRRRVTDGLGQREVGLLGGHGGRGGVVGGVGVELVGVGDGGGVGLRVRRDDGGDQRSVPTPRR